MRLQQTLYSDEAGTKPIRAYARDAEDEDRLTRVELHVIGNRIIAVPAIEPVVVEVAAVPSSAGETPVQRQSRLDAADFK